MTVTAQNNRISYTGNGVTTSFSFPYYFIAATDMKVYVAGVLKTLTTDYTISGTAPYTGGANIVFGAAPANLASIVLLADPAITQGVDLVDNDNFPVEASVETPLDRLTLICRRLYDLISRSIFLSDSLASTAELRLESIAPDGYLKINAAGDGVEAVAVGTDNSALALALAASTGAGLVGWIKNTIGAVAMTLADWLGWQDQNVMMFLSSAQRADVMSGSAPTLDISAALQAACDAAALTSAKIVTFPDGFRGLVTGRVTMTYGVKFRGTSRHSTLRPNTGLVDIRGGSVFYLTGTSLPPFVYYSGSAFEGLTFYYPNQSRTAASPTVYPATCSGATAHPGEVLVGCAWRHCQFVNAYDWIDARIGHLDFEFSNLVGAALHRGIQIDGCGGTDICQNIRMSYYYWCQSSDNAQTYMQANAQGMALGRCDAFHGDRLYFGSMNVGIRPYVGSVNVATGPYGSITGLSLDGNNYGIYSEGTHPIGINIADMMCNSLINDVIVASGSTSTSTIQISGAKYWGSKPAAIQVAYAGSTIKLSNYEIYTASVAGVSIAASGCIVNLENGLFADMGSVTPLLTTAQCDSLILTGNKFNAAPTLNNPAGTVCRWKGNANLYDRDARELSWSGDHVFGGGVVNLAKVTVTANKGATVRLESSGFVQGRSAASKITEYLLTADGTTVTALSATDYPSGGSGVITHAVSVAGLVATFTLATNSTVGDSPMESRVQVSGNATSLTEP